MGTALAMRLGDRFLFCEGGSLWQYSPRLTFPGSSPENPGIWVDLSQTNLLLKKALIQFMRDSILLQVAKEIGRNL